MFWPHLLWHSTAYPLKHAGFLLVSQTDMQRFASCVSYNDSQGPCNCILVKFRPKTCITWFWSGWCPGRLSCHYWWGQWWWHFLLLITSMPFWGWTRSRWCLLKSLETIGPQKSSSWQAVRSRSLTQAHWKDEAHGSGNILHHDSYQAIGAVPKVTPVGHAMD